MASGRFRWVITWSEYGQCKGHDPLEVVADYWRQPNEFIVFEQLDSAGDTQSVFTVRASDVFTIKQEEEVPAHERGV